MSYHDDPLVNDAVLSIINDGNGEMCGLDYEGRRAAAKRSEYGVYLYERAARAYIRYRNKHFRDLVEPRVALSAEQAESVARLLQRYYLDHLAEIG